MEDFELNWEELESETTRPVLRATVALATLCQVQVESDRALSILSSAGNPIALRESFRTLRELIDKAEKACLPLPS